MAASQVVSRCRFCASAVAVFSGLALSLASACSLGQPDPSISPHDASITPHDNGHTGLDAGSFDAAHAHQPEAASSGRAVNSAGVALPAFCARDGNDPVRDVFCADDAPTIASLSDLTRVLGLDTYQTNQGTYVDMADRGPASSSAAPPDAGALLSINVTLLGHSTALSGSLVTPINPRLIVMGTTTTLAFHRGIQRVELGTRSSADGRLKFYLVSFSQACNAAGARCSPGDLYTPRIESDWQSVLIQDDEELKNTNADCRQCHQRGSDVPSFLMREFSGPWTHFFAQDADSQAGLAYPEPLGRDLVKDYRRAKGDEPYGGVPSAILRGTIGLALVPRVGLDQPLFFDSSTILSERWPMGPNGFPTQPNRSPTWDKEFAAFKRGEHLALPFYAGRATDAEKQAALSDAYQRVRRGQLSVDALPDLADIYPDDPQLRAEIGLQTEPLASGAELLIQACGSCHNDVLDQTVTRARFSIDLSRMDEAARQLAVTRVQQATEEPGAMPPPETRQLDPVSRAKLIAYLQADTRSVDDAASLQRAAQLGMAVPLRMLSPTR